MKLDIVTTPDAVKMATAVRQKTEAPTSIAARGKREKPAPQVTKDDLYTKLLKFIPAPLIALYLTLTNLVLGAASGTLEKVILWVLFAFFALMVFFYLRQRGVHRMSQIGLSVVAFIAWATASPGPFQLIHWWKEWIGTLTMGILVTLLVVFQPAPLPDNVVDDTVD